MKEQEVLDNVHLICGDCAEKMPKVEYDEESGLSFVKVGFEVRPQDCPELAEKERPKLEWMWVVVGGPEKRKGIVNNVPVFAGWVGLGDGVHFVERDGLLYADAPTV